MNLFYLLFSIIPTIIGSFQLYIKKKNPGYDYGYLFATFWFLIAIASIIVGLMDIS